MLQLEVTDLSTVPEEARGFYKETDGKHVLQVQGAVPESRFTEVKLKLDEFRTNNTVLLKEQGKLKALSSIIGEDGLDPDKLQRRIESLAESRIQEMRTSFETQVQELQGQAQQASAQLGSYMLSAELSSAAISHGVLETALPDIINRARDAFEIKEGKLTAKGDVRNKKGEPLSVKDFIESLTTTAPHFFGQTTGVGATRPVATTVSPLTTHEKLVQGLARLRR